MKPDLIISWPRNTDYPVWREMIRNNRSRFNNVIIIFTETNQGHNYIEFVKEAMFEDFVLFITSRQIRGDEDWRNIAVNEGLFHSLHSEWIFFTEQDFTFTNDFWQYVESHEDADVICVKDQARMHPCCIFIKRKALNGLKHDFGIESGRLDHFGKIQEQIERLGLSVAVIPEHLYEHMNGLSHNFRLMSEGQTPNYQIDAFNDYLYESVTVKVPIHPEYDRIVRHYLESIGYFKALKDDIF